MKGQGRSTYPAINILIATYTLVCGMHVDQVSFGDIKNLYNPHAHLEKKLIYRHICAKITLIMNIYRGRHIL